MLLLIIILLYFGLLFTVSFFTSKRTNNDSFFLGTRKTPWIVIAIGMVGDSLSGVSFISVPGWVQSTQMTYMQMCFGFILGYIVVAFVLLPIYYKLKSPSIYSYLEERFGTTSYKTASAFFLISKLLISALRFYVVVDVLQLLVFDQFNIPFWTTTIIFLIAVWAYTFKGGVKTLIWTDLLQALFMFAALVVIFIIVAIKLDFEFSETISEIYYSPYSKMFEFSDWTSKKHFVNQFISGIFVVIVMTGLDQCIMQKNLTCRNLKEAQKNVLTYSWFFIPTNLLFLSLGILLMIFVDKNYICTNLVQGDRLLTFLFDSNESQNYLGSGVLILFIVGLIAVAFSSIDSAITTITTSFSFDILNAKKKSEKQVKQIRFFSQIGVSILIIILLLIFHYLNNKTIIDVIYVVVSYTYGPLLGLFAFGLFTKKKIKDKFVPIVAVASPFFCYLLNFVLQTFLNYSMGYLLLLINGTITFIGLVGIMKKNC